MRCTTTAESPALILAALLSVALSAAGCDSTVGGREDAGRIVIGASVDGVPLGADTLSVRRILGRPNAIQRDPRSIIYRYTRGEHAGFNVHFSIDQDRRVDERTVFTLAAPYAGRTREGIGIGTPRSSVGQHLGEADVSGTGTSGLIHDRYRTEGAETGFLYDEDQRVLSITMNGPIR